MQCCSQVDGCVRRALCSRRHDMTERLADWLVAWVAIRAVHGYKLSTIELDCRQWPARRSKRGSAAPAGGAAALRAGQRRG